MKKILTVLFSVLLYGCTVSNTNSFFGPNVADISPTEAVSIARSYIRNGHCGNEVLKQAETLVVDEVSFSPNAWGNGSIMVMFALGPRKGTPHQEETRQVLQVYFSPTKEFLHHEITTQRYYTEK
jgi:hypothetical protein